MDEAPTPVPSETPERAPRTGDIVWIRQDRHTDRMAHEAHEAQVKAYEAAVKGRQEALDRGDDPATLPALPPEPPAENPAPKSSRALPAIVFQVADDGSTVSAHVFHGARGVGFEASVSYGFEPGQWCWPQ